MSNPAASKIILQPDSPERKANLIEVGTFTDYRGEHVIRQDNISRQILIDDSVTPITRWALAALIAAAVRAGGSYITDLAKLDRTIKHLLGGQA